MNYNPDVQKIQDLQAELFDGQLNLNPIKQEPENDEFLNLDGTNFDLLQYAGVNTSSVTAPTLTLQQQVAQRLVKNTLAYQGSSVPLPQSVSTTQVQLQQATLQQQTQTLAAAPQTLTAAALTASPQALTATPQAQTVVPQTLTAAPQALTATPQTLAAALTAAPQTPPATSALTVQAHIKTHHKLPPNIVLHSQLAQHLAAQPSPPTPIVPQTPPAPTILTASPQTVVIPQIQQQTLQQQLKTQKIIVQPQQSASPPQQIIINTQPASPPQQHTIQTVGQFNLQQLQQVSSLTIYTPNSTGLSQ